MLLKEEWLRMETCNFFVPYGAYKRGLKLVEELPCESGGSDTE